MKYVLLALLCTQPAFGAQPASAGHAETLCAGNPAYSPTVMLAVVREQLQHDHDPALDADSPEKLAEQASAQGIEECAADLRADPTIATALTGLNLTDTQVGWDAYNTACADHKASRGACITAEIGAARALKHLAAGNTPPGSKAIVQTCALVLQVDPAMAEWRQCVDLALATHASEATANRCKTSVSWHSAKTGAEAARIMAGCLTK